jgi:purine-binding chemotaxis protein CheW
MEMRPDALSGQYVVFALEEQLCAISIGEVREIIKLQSITEVPGIPNYIAGMINLRGRVIPVVRLRSRFKMKSVPDTKKNRIIIVEVDGEQIGLIVDEVKKVMFVEEKDVEPPLDFFNRMERDCFTGFAKHMDTIIGIIHLKKVLFPDLEQEVSHRV